MSIRGLNHITLAVSQLDRSIAFYSELLNFTAVVKWNFGAYLTLGELWLCLSLDKPDKNIDYSHIAFDVDGREFESCREQLLNRGVKQWKENKSEGESFYFIDPDGHKLELHVGDLSTRLRSLLKRPYEGLTWLDNNTRESIVDFQNETSR